MKFTKMQGCGNDYVYVDGSRERIPQEEKPQLVRRLSDRHFGIGGDGVIFINPSDEADFEMEMYNADGTRAEMCGNGIRCVGKFVYDKGLTNKADISVISAGSVKYLGLVVKEGKVEQVKVNMGSPELKSALVPVISENGQVIDEPICVQGKNYKMTCVSMGNPHAVVYLDDVDSLAIEEIGPYFENHERFPRRTNTEFVKVGATLACGTGACAVAVACVLNGLTEETVTVKLLGGDLVITWDREADLVYMTGPAATVFEGEI